MAVDLANTQITINISLSAAPVPRAGFGKTLLLSEDVTLVAPALTVEYATTAELAAGVTAGTITQRLADAGTLAFSQSPRPAVVKYGVASAAPAAATIAGDIAAILLVDQDWYCCMVDTEAEASVAAANATLAAAAAAVEALSPGKLLIQASNDPDMYNPAVATDPASVEQDAAREQQVVIYEQLIGVAFDEFQWGAYAHTASWASFDPDVRSAPFDKQCKSILPAQTTAAAPVDLTTAQIAAINDKAGNAFVKYGAAPAFLNQGTNPVGRQVHEIMSKDWLTARLREDFASQKVAMSNRGEKWPLNDSGIAFGAALIDARLQQGLAAQHFDQITAATGSVDTDTKTITFSARAKVLGSAIAFVVNIAFTADDVDA